jgi:hypothetical protein
MTSGAVGVPVVDGVVLVGGVAVGVVPGADATAGVELPAGLAAPAAGSLEPHAATRRSTPTRAAEPCWIAIRGGYRHIRREGQPDHRITTRDPRRAAHIPAPAPPHARSHEAC